MSSLAVPDHAHPADGAAALRVALLSIATLIASFALSSGSAHGAAAAAPPKIEAAIGHVDSEATASARLTSLSGTAISQVFASEVGQLQDDPGSGPDPTYMAAADSANHVTSAAPPTSPEQAASKTYAASMDKTRMMRTIKHLSKSIGQRRAGTSKERKAADYFVKQLKSYGLRPVTRDVWVHGGRTSRNVAVFIKGRKGSDGKPLYPGKYIILGAHMDTKPPAPGADDNASGCATVLELARLFKKKPPLVSVKVVFFGAEEIVDSNRNHHHYGSRDMARRLKPGTGLLGAFIVDMIGYGPALHVRTMGKSSSVMWKRTLALKKRAGVSDATYLRDPGWSDHEPFEAKGYPVAWIERRLTPYTHSAGDNYKHIKPARLMSAARWSATYFDRLTPAHIKALSKASPGTP